MATKGEILKEYTIKINTEIEGAKKEVAGLRTALKGKLGDNIGTEIEASMEAAEASLKSLSDTVDKRIGEMNSSLRGLKLDKLQSDMKELSDSVKESVSVVKQQVDLLTTAFNSSDPARFEQFVAKITAPLAELTEAVKTATIAINNLSDIKLGAVDTSGFEKAGKQVTRSAKQIEKEFVALKKQIENRGGLSFNVEGLSKQELAEEAAMLSSLIALYDEANSIKKKTKNSGINPKVLLGSVGAGDIDTISDYLEDVQKALGLAGDKSKPLDLKMKLKVSFDASKDIDQKAINDYVEKVQKELIKKVQEAVDAEPVKLKFGWDVETDDTSKSGEKTGDVLKDADKVLYKTLKIRMEGDESRLKANLEGIVEKINAQIQGNDKFAIKVDIIPNDIAKGTVLQKVMDFGTVSADAVSSGGKVTGEVKLQGTDGLATEATLQQIRDLLASGPNGPKGGAAAKAAELTANDKNWNAAYSKVDAFREQGARNYNTLETYNRVINEEVIALAQTNLRLQKQFKFFTGMESNLFKNARDAIGKKAPDGKLTNIGGSDLYNSKITVNGQDYSTYARYSTKFDGLEVTLKEWQDYLDSLQEQELRDLFKQMKKEATTQRKNVQKTLVKNGIEYKYNKKTKQWRELDPDSSLNGASSTKDIIEELRTQHRAVVKGYEEEAAITERYIENLKERRTLAEDLVRMSESGLNENYNPDEYLVKQNRLKQLTRTYKGNTVEEQAESAEKFNRLIEEQRALIGKDLKTEADYKRINEITNEIITCFSDVADIMAEARNLLRVDEKTGKTKVDALIEENEALFERQKRTAKMASDEYFTRSLVVNPETSAGIYSLFHTAREKKTGNKDAGGFFSKAALEPFGGTPEKLLQYLDSAEEYQNDLDKIAKLSSRIAELERLSVYVPSNVKGQRGTYESGITRTEAGALRRWRKERKEAMQRVSTYDAQRNKDPITKKNIQKNLDEMSKRQVSITNTSLEGELRARFEKVYTQFVGKNAAQMEEVILQMTPEEFAKFKGVFQEAKESIEKNGAESVTDWVKKTEEHLFSVLQADLREAEKILASDESSAKQKLHAVDDIRSLREEIAYLRDPNAYVEKYGKSSMVDQVQKFVLSRMGVDVSTVLSDGTPESVYGVAREMLGVQATKMGIRKAPDVTPFMRNLAEAIDLADELGIDISTRFKEMPEAYRNAFRKILSRDLAKKDKLWIEDGNGNKHAVFEDTNVNFMSAGSIQNAKDSYLKAYGDFREKLANNYEAGLVDTYMQLEEMALRSAREIDKTRTRGRLVNTIEVDGRAVPEVAHNRQKLLRSSYEGQKNGFDTATILPMANKMSEYEQKRADAAAEAARKAQDTADHNDKAAKSIQDQIANQETLIAARKQEIKDLEERNRLIEQASASETQFINGLAGEDRKSGELKGTNYSDLRWKATKIGDAYDAFELERAEKAGELPLLPIPGSGKKSKNPIIQRLRAQYYTDKASNPAVQKLRQKIYKNREQKVLDETQPLLDSLTSELWLIPREIIERENEYFLKLFSSGDFRNAFYSENDISSFIRNEEGFNFKSILKRILEQFDADTLAEAYESNLLSKQDVVREASLYLMASGKNGKIQNQAILDILKEASAPLQYDSRIVDQAAFSRAVKEITKGKTVDREYDEFIGHKYDENGKKTSERLYQRRTEKVRIKGIEELEQELADMKSEAAIEKDRETILSKYGQDALAAAEEIDVLIFALERLNKTTGEKNSEKIAEYQNALSGAQDRAKGLGLTIAKSGRAHSSKYYSRFGMAGMPTTIDESKIYTEEAQNLRNSIRKAAIAEEKKEAERRNELEEEVGKLRWDAVDAQLEENKVAKARAALTEQEIKDLKEASKYAGMTQEQADAAYELNEFNKQLSKAEGNGKKISGKQRWRQAYLQEAAKRTGLTISDRGNAYLNGFDTDEWMKNPFAYKGNSYTDRIFAEYKPKEYQKAVDSGLALEVTQKAVLNAINSLKKEGVPTKDGGTTIKSDKSLSSTLKGGKKQSKKQKAIVPQEIQDAQKLFRDKGFKSFDEFDDAAKVAAKTAILSGRNIYVTNNTKKPENNGKYGISSSLAGKNGFSDLTKDIANKLGIDLPDLDTLRKAATENVVETKASAEAVVIEANATETLVEQMIAAAKAKEDFAKANGLVLDTAAESTPKIEEETKAAEELNEELQKMTRVNWEALTPEAQKKITDEFGEDVDVYASKGTSNYRVVGRRKTGSVNEKGELTGATAKIVNRLTESKAAEKAAEQEAKKDSKSEYSSRLDEKLKRYEDLLGRKAKGDESFNKEIALLEARILDNIDELANSEYHDENLEFNVMERFGAIQKSFGRNKDNFKYKQQQKAEAEAQREANNAAERKAREERQAQEKAQREADNAAKKAQGEADKKAADKKKADEKEASKNDAETLKKFQEDATAHNKDAAASYKELSKSADEYIKLVDRSQAADFSDDERVRLDSLEEKWSLAYSAKRLYYLADLEKQGSLTQEQADELRQLRDFWSEATQEQRLYLIAADGTESSIKAVRDAMDGIDSANDKALERYFSSAREEAQKLLNVLDGIASGNYTDAFKAQAKALRDSIFKIDESGSKTGFMTMLDSDAPFDQVMAQREMLRRQGANIRAGMGDAGNRAAKSVSINSLLSSAERTRKTYLGMPTDLLNQYDAIIERLKWMQGQEFGVVSVEEVSKEAAALKGLDAQLEASGRKTAGVFGTVTNRLTDMNAKFIAQYFSIQDWIRYMRTAVTTVIELDTALTELRKVSSETDERLAQSMRNSAKTATMLGSTITDVVNATADWARLGYNVDQAEELARVSILYKNVGDNIDIDTASSSLISTMKGYQLEADQAESIVDKFNEIGNNFAINSAEIGEALKRSAASFNASGTSLDKSIALVTAANTVAQNAESVGGLMRPPI